MSLKILYTSDLHGNVTQYEKLIDHAKKISADIIIIGGDIAPKNAPVGSYIRNQRHFLEHKLPEMLRLFKEELHTSNFFLMMGNDDCSANLDVVNKEDSVLYQIIHCKRINLIDDFDIVGYSYVPITPFGIKDWEKFDLSHVPLSLEGEYAYRKKMNYSYYGLKSNKTGWEKFRFDDEMEKLDSIQKDLTDEIFQKNADKTIYIIHTPPNKTNLDQLYNGIHVGSLALREFIENHQPHLTLHGHIHETVDVSGSFKDYIGDTLCMSSGNHPEGNNLVVLVFDLYNPHDVKRITI